MMDFRWIKELWEGKKFLGPTVEKVAATPVTGTLFTVAGGRIIVTSIVGQITTVMNAVATVIRLIATPTAPGTAVNICEDVDIQGFAEGDLIGISGIPGDDLVPAAGVSSGSIPAQTVGVVVKPGTIRMNLGAGGTTGQIRWTLHYIKLDIGASVS